MWSPSSGNTWPDMQRISIVGTTGVGKTTLAERVSATLGIPHVDLDTLFWEPHWTKPDTTVFRARVAATVAGERWIVAGNYSVARDLVWTRADTVVWLDYPLPLILWRLFWRTTRRIVTQEELWGGNRETFQAQFLSRDSLFLWALQSRPRQQREYPQLLARPEYHHLRLVRLRSPRETERWVRTLTHSERE